MTTVLHVAGLDAALAQLRRHGLLGSICRSLKSEPAETRPRSPASARPRPTAWKPVSTSTGPAPGAGRGRRYRQLHHSAAWHAAGRAPCARRGGPPRAGRAPAGRSTSRVSSGCSRTVAPSWPPGSGSEAGRGSAAVAIAATLVRGLVARAGQRRPVGDELASRRRCRPRARATAPRAPPPASTSRIASYSASLRRWASTWAGASSAGSAPKKSFSRPGRAARRGRSVGSARQSSSAARPASVSA